jgi:hypothetical protein
MTPDPPIRCQACAKYTGTFSKDGQCPNQATETVCVGSRKTLLCKEHADFARLGVWAMVTTKEVPWVEPSQENDDAKM